MVLSTVVSSNVSKEQCFGATTERERILMLLYRWCFSAFACICAYKEKQRGEKRGSWASCGFCLDSSVCRNVLSLRLCPFAKRSWD